jgi:hypothetical protein
MEELFERYEKLKATCNKWSKIENRKGLDYKDCEAFQKECEKIGFTFDFGLSAEPNNLRAIEINVPLDKHLTSDNANQYFDSYTERNVIINITLVFSLRMAQRILQNICNVSGYWIF